MTKIDEIKKRLMNPAFQKGYEKADAEFASSEALVRARSKAKPSQSSKKRAENARLAERSHLK